MLPRPLLSVCVLLVLAAVAEGQFGQPRRPGREMKPQMEPFAADGTIALRPLATLVADDAAELARTLNVVACFVPDAATGDGSCDLVLGVPWRMPGSDMRVIRDFIAPRR